jgi:hypothetical protein
MRYNYHERAEIPLTGLTPPHILAWLKPGPVFPPPYVMAFSMFNELK